MSVDVLRGHVMPLLDRIRPNGQGGFKASCPVPTHGKGNGDRNPSLEIAPGRVQPVVFRCHAGCDQEDVKDALISLGVDWGLCSTPRSDNGADSDLWMPCGKKDSGGYDHDHRKVAEYRYLGPEGELIFAVARCALKGAGCQGFRQWRPDPASRSGKRWSRRLPDGTLVGDGIPYRLPEVLAELEKPLARNIYVVEGEKDADRLWALGYPATCNAGGAGKWSGRHAAWLAGADVMVIADRDDPGWTHAETVANTLMPHARSIEVRRAAVGKDVSDHLDAGETINSLVTVAIALEPGTTENGGLA